jgi:hypothetical protein
LQTQKQTEKEPIAIKEIFIHKRKDLPFIKKSFIFLYIPLNHPMVDRYLVEQVFSYFGLVFWSLQLAPQGKDNRLGPVSNCQIFC